MDWKKRITLISLVILAAAMNGCSSNDAAKTESSEFGAADATELEQGPSEDELLTEDDELIADLGSEEGASEDSLFGDPPAEEGDGFATGEGEALDGFEGPSALGEAPADPMADPLANGDGMGEMAPSEPLAAAEDSEQPPTEPIFAEPEAFSEEAAISSPPIEPTVDESEPSWVPVKKMAEAPFQKNGVLANALYIVREGDTLSSISQKIYGEDRTTELLNVNTTLGRGVKVGDKVYYNSPQRPEDATNMNTYYGDVGLQPEVYVSKAGDNLRAVSKQLLGHPRSWMEVWATNAEIDSKGELPSGTRVQYWTGDGAPTQHVADAEVVPDSPQGKSSGLAMNEPMPPPEPIEPMENESNRFDDEETGSISPPPSANEVLPPPPPPAQASIEPPPPPPPPPPQRKEWKPKETVTAEASAGDESGQMTMMVIGALALIAGVAGFVVMRKRRAKHVLDFEAQTQTETRI